MARYQQRSAFGTGFGGGMGLGCGCLVVILSPVIILVVAMLFAPIFDAASRARQRTQEKPAVVKTVR